ncbi:winged helix-turn-helix transcriptional regulator [Candidatus Pelagibacter sp. Uisw_130]|uniref:winged helix-turn-helix transcriptional regulator n=1 Tax=Candidatus Pelagibacter sp. Uisw_130 TaxID=3230989 RepID=UPI0039EA3A7E
MKAKTNYTDSNHLMKALSILNGKWKIQIIEKLTYGEMRFGELKKALKLITSQSLSKELKVMEINSLIKRKVFKSNLPHVEYSLTEYGKSTDIFLKPLIKWGSVNKKENTLQLKSKYQELIELYKNELTLKQIKFLIKKGKIKI